MPTKTTGKGLQRVTSRVWYLTDPDKPRPPGTRSKGGEAMLHCFREEEEKTRDVRKNLFIWIAILSSNNSNGFSSFKIIKAALLNTVTRLCLCLSVCLSVCALLAWQNYTFVLPKQLQLGCSQIVHIWINRKKNNNRNSTNI